MGTILKAVCTACNFNKQLFTGGGMHNFTTYHGLPAINLKTKKLVVENYMKKEELKGKVIFYNEAGMSESSGELTANEDDTDVGLYTEKNKCPACGKYTMNFEFAGVWD